MDSVLLIDKTAGDGTGNLCFQKQTSYSLKQYAPDLGHIGHMGNQIATRL